MKDTIKIQLESGAEKDIPLDFIIEYGSMCNVIDRTSCFDTFQRLAPGRKHYFIRVLPHCDTIFISEESMREVVKLKEKTK